jgi:hypothetical protein
MKKVCKTFMRRFDPDPRLQAFPCKSKQMSWPGRFSMAFRGCVFFAIFCVFSAIYALIRAWSETETGHEYRVISAFLD